MANKFQFMSLANLTQYHDLLSKDISAQIQAASAKSLKTVSQSADGYILYFYKTDSPTTEADAVFSIQLPSPVDISGKMDKVTDAIPGNIAVFDPTGSVVDSIRTFSDFATAAQGQKADSAIQSVTASKTNGNITVDGTDVPVAGLGSAAFTTSDAYEPAGASASLKTQLTAEITKNKESITGLTSRMSMAESDILAINHPSTGILSRAKKYTDDGIAGLKISDYATKAYVDTGLSTKVGTSDVYTKPQTDDALSQIRTSVSDIAGYVGTIPAGSKASDVISYIKEMVKAAEEGAGYDDTELRALIGSNTNSLNILAGSGDGSVKKQIADSIASIMADAPAAYDTLKEIADWITNHTDSASAMNLRISTNKEDIDNLKALIGQLPQGASSKTIVAYITEYVSQALADSDLSQYAKAQDLATAVARLSSAESNIAAIETSMAEGGAIANAVEAAKKAGTDAQAAVNSLSGRVGVIPESSGEDTVIGYIDEQVKNTNDTITDLSFKVAAVEADIDSQESKINCNALNIETNAADIAVLNNSVETSQTALNRLEKYVGTFTPTSGETTVVQYIDKKTADAVKQAAYDDTPIKKDILDNKTAISQINDPATGILIAAKSDATVKAGQALMDAKIYTDSLRDTTVAANTSAISKNAGDIAALQTIVGDGFQPITAEQISALFG